MKELNMSDQTLTKIYLTTEKDQIINPNDTIQPTTINLFLVVTLNQIRRLFPLLYSLTKYSESTFNVHIMTDVCNFDTQMEYFRPLISDKLNITFLDDTKLREIIQGANIPFKFTPFSYGKMLAPILFPNLDKILYLDYDTIITNKGIEWLYNINLKDKYLAVKNGVLNYGYGDKRINHEHQIFATRGNFYFNTGVILFNIQKMIQDGKDQEIINAIKNIPTSDNNEEMARIKEQINYEGTLKFQFYEQSLLNWIFKQNDVIKFNSSFNSEEDNLFPVNQDRVNILKNIWGFTDYRQYYHNIVIAHYCGGKKPWIYIGEDRYVSDYQRDLHIKYRTLRDEIRNKGIQRIVYTII